MPMDVTLPTVSEGAVTAAQGDVPLVHPVDVLGLQFRNPLGLAAGFDRKGRRLPVLMRLGFGHIEVGTLTPGIGHFCPPAAAQVHVQIGISIGSARRGISQPVIDDYLTMLASVWPSANCIVAQLSSPFLARTGDTPGVGDLLGQLGRRWLDLGRQTRRHVPLLVKIACAPDAPIPAAIDAARDIGLSGVVLASATLQQLSAARDAFDRGVVISVGGVTSAADVRTRLSAGASLVQIHTALVRGGADTARRMLAELQASR